jgi:solute carrier family 25 (adenine nucleotide translocator) protein 4/5/6/31
MFFIGNCVSGGAAGATSLAFVHPLDFVRTRLAADVGSGKGREFNGIIDCLSKSAKNGIGGLYNGFGISVVGIVAYRASYFGMFDTGKVLLFEDIRKANFFTIWGFAQVVTIGTGIVTYPFDTVRRRLMMNTGKIGADSMYYGTLDCFKKIYANEGARGFFKGCLCNILKSPSGALVLVFYDNIQAMFKEGN